MKRSSNGESRRPNRLGAFLLSRLPRPSFAWAGISAGEAWAESSRRHTYIRRSYPGAVVVAPFGRVIRFRAWPRSDVTGLTYAAPPELIGEAGGRPAK
jgi:hypothetical protein